jgi:hypothetical protein
VLRIIFWFIIDEITGDWQEVHNEALQNLHSSTVLQERHHLEDLGIDGRLILKWLLQKQGGMA